MLSLRRNSVSRHSEGLVDKDYHEQKNLEIAIRWKLPHPKPTLATRGGGERGEIPPQHRIVLTQGLERGFVATSHCVENANEMLFDAGFGDVTSYLRVLFPLIGEEINGGSWLRFDSR